MTMENSNVENEMNPLCVVSDQSQINGRQQNEGMEIAQTDQLNKTLVVKKPHLILYIITVPFQRQHINIGHFDLTSK